MKTYIQKNNLRCIKISDINSDLPDLKNVTESKANEIANWLSRWIETELSSGRISVNDLLPPKTEFAYILGVSTGTVQNAFRRLEDLGYVDSKQCIGTLVRDYREKNSVMRKLTSKREIAAERIKKYILDNNIETGKDLISSRSIAQKINCSVNTARLALEYLCSQGILYHNFRHSRQTGWIVKTNNFEVMDKDANETLVSKIQNDLKAYISKNLELGSKMPAHYDLAKELNVSIKTIHDALKALIDEGILLARRGRYGTSVIKMPYDMPVKPETSIFAPAQDAAFYYYERTRNHIKKMIIENYPIGSKLPSIAVLSKQLDLSPNTVRRAFQNLAKEGYLAFSRGRYGGTFVIDVPEEQGFKWLSVNPQYVEVYK